MLVFPTRISIAEKSGGVARVQRCASGCGQCQ